MSDDPRFSAGDRVPGTKWVVCEVLGQGGMGIVYGVAKEPSIRAAIKVMHPRFARRSEFVERFFDEVRLLASLEHPNIVRVYDYDTLDDGSPFVIMEWLKGRTLREALRARKRTFPAVVAYEITRQLCEGLYRAHSHAPPVVHRDVKPANIFLHQPPFGDPVVKLVDFGVATLSDGKRARGLFGTPLYMAPEQLRGERVTLKTDLYAAALVLYEMITGRFPWDLAGGSTQQIVEAHLNRAPTPPTEFVPQLPRAVEAHILCALAKDPDDRPRDAYAWIGKLFELQWMGDGSAQTVDVNTTAPTLATVLEDSLEGRAEGAEAEGESTYRGMTPPPLEGDSLELASLREGDTIEAEPDFGPTTRARARTPLTPVTKVPSSSPSVDRSAPTHSYEPDAPRDPRTDTDPQGRTARPFHDGPEPEPALGSPMRLRWEPAAGAARAMNGAAGTSTPGTAPASDAGAALPIRSRQREPIAARAAIRKHARQRRIWGSAATLVLCVVVFPLMKMAHAPQRALPEHGVAGTLAGEGPTPSSIFAKSATGTERLGPVEASSSNRVALGVPLSDPASSGAVVPSQRRTPAASAIVRGRPRTHPTASPAASQGTAYESSDVGELKLEWKP